MSVLLTHSARPTMEKLYLIAVVVTGVLTALAIIARLTTAAGTRIRSGSAESEGESA
jgi:hypothetical protein